MSVMPFVIGIVMNVLDEKVIRVPSQFVQKNKEQIQYLTHTRQLKLS